MTSQPHSPTVSPLPGEREEYELQGQSDRSDLAGHGEQNQESSRREVEGTQHPWEDFTLAEDQDTHHTPNHTREELEPPEYEPRSNQGPGTRSNNNSRDMITKPPISRRMPFCFLIFIYLPLLIVPWGLTCALNYHPLSHDSYNSSIEILPSLAYEQVEQTYLAIRVLNSVLAYLTVPMISMLLAYGAVVFTQRKSQKQKLSLNQTIALADRGWANLSIVFRSVDSSRHHGSIYLYLGFVLILLAVVNVPLQTLLVTPGQIQVANCQEYGEGRCDYLYSSSALIAHTPSLHMLQDTPRIGVTQQILHNLIIGSMDTLQPHLWSLGGSGDQPYSTLYYAFDDLEPQLRRPIFVSTVPALTATGVLTQTAMRMDSTAQCEIVDSSMFPSPCPGPVPFNNSYSSGDTGSWEYPPLAVDICVPGDSSNTPWNLSLNRQEVTEEIFIRVTALNASASLSSEEYSPFSYTQHCTAQSNLGFFELGNNQNGGLAQDIKTYPAGQVETSTYESPNEPYYSVKSKRANSDLWSPADDIGLITPGPLMSTAVAIFGNGSFFQTAANATNRTEAVREICSGQGVPFESGFYGYAGISHRRSSPCEYGLEYTTDLSLQGLMWSFFYSWNDTTDAEALLGIALFYANEALMMQALSADNNADLSTTGVWSDPGTVYIKPSVSLVAIIIISVVIGLQVLGILVLMVYITRSPTWTPTLNALATARIGAALLPETLPAMGELKFGYAKLLDHVDGIVGVVGERQDGVYGKVPILGLGGEGIVRKRGKASSTV